jgi:DNA-binding transcriptional LysR family regulator
MDTRFLQSFLAVVELGSIAEAARRLDLAPTTVTQQIRALEGDIGSKLLTRAGRTVKPTVVGARIADRARDLVRDVRDRRSAATETGRPAGPVRLGATPTALMGWLPPLLRRWMQVHANIPIYIEPGTSAILLDRVISAELDGAIFVHPAFDLPKACAWRLLREEPLILLTSVRLSVQDALVTAAREPFIRYDRNVLGGKLADEYLRAHGVRPKVNFELDGIEHIAKLVAEGFGVSVLPDWPVIGTPDPQLRRGSLATPSPVRRGGLGWLRTSVRSQLAEEFVRMACSEQAEVRKKGRKGALNT